MFLWYSLSPEEGGGRGVGKEEESATQWEDRSYVLDKFLLRSLMLLYPLNHYIA